MAALAGREGMQHHQYAVQCWDNVCGIIFKCWSSMQPLFGYFRVINIKYRSKVVTFPLLLIMEELVDGACQLLGLLNFIRWAQLWLVKKCHIRDEKIVKFWPKPGMLDKKRLHHRICCNRSYYSCYRVATSWMCLFRKKVHSLW